MSEREPWVGVQMHAASMLAEGADHVCDYLATEGGVNAVLVGSHGGGYGEATGPVTTRPDNWAEHGRPVPELLGQPNPGSFIPVHEAYYAATSLRQARDPAVHRWADRDVLAETIAAARPRGIQVYARHLEGFHPSKAWQMDGFAQVMQVDVYGRRQSSPCWNHPDYRAWWLAMTEEWCKGYELDGLILGPERDGPMGPTLYNGDAPRCFCRHCRAQAAECGIDIERAKRGWRELHEYITRVGEGERPSDGILTGVMRLWIRHPEIMAWERLMNEAKWGLHAEIYGAVKALRPAMEVGWMVPVYPIKHDLFARAGAYDYAEMAAWSDFIKPNIYQDVNAARLRDWVDNRPLLWRDLSPRQLHELLYGLFGFGSDEPDYEASADQPFSPDFVHKEVRRVKDAVGDRCKCYAGIGVDIPHARIGHIDADLQTAHTAAAFAAGAEGVLLSREYEFMRTETLNAVRAGLPKR